MMYCYTLSREDGCLVSVYFVIVIVIVFTLDVYWKPLPLLLLLLLPAYRLT